MYVKRRGHEPFLLCVMLALAPSGRESHHPREEFRHKRIHSLSAHSVVAGSLKALKVTFVTKFSVFKTIATVFPRLTLSGVFSKRHKTTCTRCTHGAGITE